jgi:xanthine/uracil permease
MSDMSPLGRLILQAMRVGSIFVAGCVLFFMGILIWQKWLSQAAPPAVRGDFVFLGILAVLFVGALWLARSVSRELKR